MRSSRISKAGALFVFFLAFIAVLVFSGDTPANCPPADRGAAEKQLTDAWCWAANLTYISNWFGCNWMQCNWASWFRDHFNYGPKVCCSWWVCNEWSPTVSELITGMSAWGFDLWDSSDLREVHDPDLLAFLLCPYGTPDDGWIALGIFGPDGSTATGNGHGATIEGYDDTEPLDVLLPIRYMEPFDGTHYLDPWYYLVHDFTGHALNGKWLGNIWVRGVPGCQVPIGDIQEFRTNGESNGDVSFSITFAAGTNPAEYADLYVTDNDIGPARLVESWHPFSVPPEVQTTVTYLDTLRLHQSTIYQYYLDYGGNQGSLVQNPKESLKPLINPPVSYDTGPSREVLGAPTNLTVTDTPLDFGYSLDLSWTLSSDDQNVDYYNVYKRSVDTLSSYRHVATVPQGVATYRDESVVPGYTYRYKVSAAHHGTTGITTGGNLGIWNDFSSEADGTPLSQFADVTAIVSPNDTLTTAPNGSEDTIQLSATILDANSVPTAGVPATDLAIYIIHDSLFSCAGDTISADGPTDGTGTTTFTVPYVGGHGQADLLVMYVPLDWPITVTTIHVRSPDGNSDGVVDLVDWSLIGACWLSQCGDANYIAKWDLNWDCEIDIIDLSIVGDNFLTGCP